VTGSGEDQARTDVSSGGRGVQVGDGNVQVNFFSQGGYGPEGQQDIRTLNERFARAADQLGSDKPTIQLAGVYALAGLADDWEEKRQTCIDLMCGYLRMPYEPSPGPDAPESQRLTFQASRQVRHTVIRVITAHLQENAAVSWQGLHFDFTGAVFDGGDFSNAVFSDGMVHFDRAKFSSGTVSFRNAEFCGGTVSFSGAEFCGGTVSFSAAKFSGSKVHFYFAQFSDGMVRFESAQFSRGTVAFGSAQFSGGRVSFFLAEVSGGTIDFHLALFSSGKVDFTLTKFSGGTVSYFKAKFSGGAVDFDLAAFSGGTVDLTDPCDWSVPPKFRSIDAPHPGVKLPSGAA